MKPILAATLALGLAACAGANTSTPEAPAPAAVTTTTATTVATAPAAALNPVGEYEFATQVNGEAVTAPRQLRQGDQIAVGRQTKSIVKMPLTVRTHK